MVRIEKSLASIASILTSKADLLLILKGTFALQGVEEVS